MKPYTLPTVEQKIEIYSITMQMLINDERMCICSGIIAAQDQNHMKLYDWSKGEETTFKTNSSYVDDLNNMSINFPEIDKHRPKFKSHDEFWWGTDNAGMKIRIDILKEEIDALKATLK